MKQFDVWIVKSIVLASRMAIARLIKLKAAGDQSACIDVQKDPFPTGGLDRI
jgi:hypothetical protein